MLEQVYPTDPIPLHLPLCPNGQQWLEVGDVSFDQPGFYAHSPRFVWPVDLQYNMPIGREPIDYFQLLCPPFIAKATAITNTNIAKDTILDSRWREPLSVKEMMKYIGIRLATTIDSERISLHDQWNGMDQSETIFTALDYEEQYGMSKTRFDIINKNFALDEPPHDVEVRMTMSSTTLCLSLCDNNRKSSIGILFAT